MLIVSTSPEHAGHQRSGHPERPDRITAALAGVEDLRLGCDLTMVPSYAADRSDLERVHAPAYLDELSSFCQSGGGDLDPDTYATADSWTIARFAAGAGLAAIGALQESDDGIAFIVARPPGHHALRDRALGFCLLNNIAVAAAALVDQGERVLIVDWDVHHGNGTQAIFWDEPNVLYVSTHQWPLFPGSGEAREVGGPGALGKTVNIPVPPGATGDVLRRALDEVAAPVIDKFDPTWVLVSAGFDAHRADPMADLALTSGDFSDMATTVAAFAPRAGRLALFLEGGYNLGALRTSVATTLGTLLGCRYEPEAPTFGGPGTEMVREAKDIRLLSMLQAQQAAWSEDRSR